tara:strand:- start:16085 stop:18139 length:2055 start_codon:yes stop_codon:yes gene_type:complete
MKTKIYSVITLLFLSLSIYAQVDRTKIPESGPAPKINIGTPEKFTLPNGLQVLVVENHKLPRVSVTLDIDNPPSAKGEKKGVEGFVGSMLGTGTTTISKEKYDNEVDYLGANIGFGSESAFASSLSKYFPRILELMADAAFNPVFTQEEFDKQMKQALDGIKNSESSVSAIAGRVNRLLTYGKNHPYGEFTSEKTLKNITLQDVKDYYGKVFKPNNAYLVVIGDVDFKTVKKQITTLFSDWKKADETAQNFDPLPEVKNPYTTEINFINMPSAVQTEISVVNAVNLKMNDKDYFAALLANQILGGGSTGMLAKNIREDKGYTYSTGSGISASRYASRFIASGSVRNIVTDSAVVEFMKEINKIRYKKSKPEDLAIAKAKYVGSFIKNVENPRTIAGYALNILQNDLPADYYENYLKNIKAVTLEDVQNAAIKYFRGDKARIVITGKAIDVLDNLEKTDYVIKYFDKEGNPTEKPPMTMPIPEGMTAASVVDNYIEAIGGKDKVMTVKSVMTVANATIQGTPLVMTQKMAAPNKSSLVVTVMGNAMQRVIFDGTTGYQEVQGRKMDMQPTQIEEAKASAQPFTDMTYTSGTLDRIEPIDGVNFYVIKNGDTEIFYDMKTGLKSQEIKTVKTPNGDVQVPTTFSDYKEVNGILFPHAIGTKSGPMDLKFEVSEIKINEGVSDEDFK